MPEKEEKKGREDFISALLSSDEDDSSDDDRQAEENGIEKDAESDVFEVNWKKTQLYIYPFCIL